MPVAVERGVELNGSTLAQSNWYKKSIGCVVPRNERSASPSGLLGIFPRPSLLVSCMRLRGLGNVPVRPLPRQVLVVKGANSLVASTRADSSVPSVPKDGTSGATDRATGHFNLAEARSMGQCVAPATKRKGAVQRSGCGGALNRCWYSLLLLLLMLLTCVDVVEGVFTPVNNADFRAALGSCSCQSSCYGTDDVGRQGTPDCTGGCLGETSDGSCPKFAAQNGNGVLGDWDVSKVTDMSMDGYNNLGSAFNRDLSKWITSKVITMENSTFATTTSSNSTMNCPLKKLLFFPFVDCF